MEDIQQRYTDTVLSHLENMKQTMDNLQPLNYRAEVLEDLFSLLFVRSDDVLSVSESESGPEDCVSNTGPNTPKGGVTPALFPSSPSQLTPVQLENHHSHSLNVDLVSRFIEGLYSRYLKLPVFIIIIRFRTC